MAIKIDFTEFTLDLPEVKDASIYKTGTTNHQFSETGLYSEQIFGPLKNYKCSCGNVVSKINAGIRCEICNVLCESDKLRNTQFARIELPKGIFIILPTLIKNLHDIFGQNPIKSIMDKAQYQHNCDRPYYFLNNFSKLVKIPEKDKDKDNYLKDYPVYDISSLHRLFQYLRDETDALDSRISKKYLDYVFVDYVLVLPVNSRPIVKITNEKSNVHPITEKYAEILKNKSNSLVDDFHEINEEMFGATVYKYQNSVNQLYDIILQKNFQQKESVSRDYMMGKIIEHSGRFVIVPNPILKPYQIGLQSHAIKEINVPEIKRFIYQKYAQNSSDEKIMDYLINIDSHNSFSSVFNISDDLLKEFLAEQAKNLIYVCERPPVLWKYNVTAFFLGLVNWSEKDVTRVMVPFTSVVKKIISKFTKPDAKKMNYRKSIKSVSVNFGK
jgi:DNA-directed RNA polymerase beta' subunit